MLKIRSESKMKFYTILLLGALFLSSCNQPSTETNSAIAVTDIQKVESRLLRHVVLFKFKETATAADIEKVEAAFIALPSKVSVIKDFEWGLNNSPEGVDKGFTHCFFLSFGSEADRAVYLPHPEHKAFGELLGPYLEDVLVLDYWNQ